MSTDISSQSAFDAKKTELKVDEILAEFLSKKIGDPKTPKNLDKKKKHSKHKHKKSKSSRKEKKSNKTKISKKRHEKKSHNHHKSRHHEKSDCKSASLTHSSKKSYHNSENKFKNEKTEDVLDFEKHEVKEPSLICSEDHSEDELIKKKLEKLQSHIIENKNVIDIKNSSMCNTDETTDQIVNENLSNQCTASEKSYLDKTRSEGSLKKKSDSILKERQTEEKIETFSPADKEINSSSRDSSPVNKKDPKTKNRKSHRPSRSNVKKSKLTHSRHRSKSPSPDHHRRRSRSKSESRRSRYDYHHSYRSKRKYCRSSRSFSKSPTPKRRYSRDSRHSSKEKSDKPKIDKNKLLEIARKNALSMIQTGQIPANINKEKEQLVAITSGGRSVAELTDFCKSLAQGSNNSSSNNENSEDEGKQSEDEEGPFINHPFKISENKPNIIMNIRAKLVEQLIGGNLKCSITASTSRQAIASAAVKQPSAVCLVGMHLSGGENKSSLRSSLKNLVEVKKYQQEPETEQLVSANAVQVPVKTPAEKATEQAKLRLQFPVSSGSQHRVKESEWIPVVKEKKINNSKSTASSTPAHIVTLEQQINESSPNSQSKVQENKSQADLDLSRIVFEKLSALSKLKENPQDVVALTTIDKADKKMQSWVQSKQLPGQFTGSTDAQLLSPDQLSGPNPAWTRKFDFVIYHLLIDIYFFSVTMLKKDLFHRAQRVEGGMGMYLLQKMGWEPGKGLGKNNEGSVEPLLLDIKTDKKGLVSQGETVKKNVNPPVARDLSGKHPVSALMELCSKRKWGPPEFSLIFDGGPDHKKHFLYKVKVNAVEFQPAVASTNKKHAKAQTASICLQHMGLLPKS
ncbi:Protein SON [Nymphon striatum]|nr:Protein SON [Nymphon striatum]